MISCQSIAHHNYKAAQSLQIFFASPPPQLYLDTLGALVPMTWGIELWNRFVRDQSLASLLEAGLDERRSWQASLLPYWDHEWAGSCCLANRNNPHLWLGRLSADIDLEGYQSQHIENWMQRACPQCLEPSSDIAIFLLYHEASSCAQEVGQQCP